MKKYYVAGKADDFERVKELMDWIDSSKKGKVTYDWTSYKLDCAKPLVDFLKESAELDCGGIDQADTVVALMDRDYSFRGTWVEIGYAIGSHKKVVIIGRENAKRCNFTFLREIIIVDSIEEFKQKLMQGDYD